VRAVKVCGQEVEVAPPAAADALEQIRGDFPSRKPVPRHQDWRTKVNLQLERGKPLTQITRAQMARIGVDIANAAMHVRAVDSAGRRA
jgi:hypothetical protein